MTLDARAGVRGASVELRDRDVMLAFVAGLTVAICWRNPAAGLLSQLSADLFRARSESEPPNCSPSRSLGRWRFASEAKR